MQAQPNSSTGLSQGQDAYFRIVADIRTGVLRPGERLLETELAAKFGISRTPIREAIRQLESDGLITHTPRVGATIRQLDHAEISELYEMRAVLEGTAAKLAARAASEVELTEIAKIQATMNADQTIAQLYDLNQQFHAAILNAARNRFLVKSIHAVNTTLLILGRSTLEDAPRAKAAITEHDAVLKALIARDGKTAEAHMRAHIEAAHLARLGQMRRSDGVS